MLLTYYVAKNIYILVKKLYTSINAINIKIKLFIALRKLQFILTYIIYIFLLLLYFYFFHT